jgi:hypothetical protein
MKFGAAFWMARRRLRSSRLAAIHIPLTLGWQHSRSSYLWPSVALL